MRWTCLAAMTAVVLGGMILAPSVRAAGPLWAYTHPEAKVLIGVDWQRAKSSPTWQMIRKQLLELGGSLTSSSQGIGFIDSVDQILVSAPGELSGNTAESPMLIILQGKVDHAALRQSMIPGTAVERYRGLDLLIPPQGEGQDVIAALVNDSLTLLGDRASIELVLEDGHGLRDAALRERAEQLAFASEIWMIAAIPPMKAGAAAEANPLAASFDSVLAMDLGLSLAQGLGLKVNLEFADAASAQSLALGAQVITSMLMSGDSATPEIARIVRGLNIEQTGAALSLNVDIPLDLLEQGLLQAKSSAGEAGPRTLEGLLGMNPRPGPVPGLRPAAGNAGQTVWPIEPETRTIRIIGLEDGVREINYTVGGRRP